MPCACSGSSANYKCEYCARWSCPAWYTPDSLWSHCRYQFCFYIFDKDKNGFIAKEELKSLITLLYTKGVVANLKAGLFKFDTDKDGASTGPSALGFAACKFSWLEWCLCVTGVINFKEFVQMARQFPQMLNPAFQIQDKLQVRFQLADVWRRAVD